MLTLTAVIIGLGLRWLLPGSGVPDNLAALLYGLLAAVAALCSWLDLSPTLEQWRTPFASAIAYIAGVTLYAAMLPSTLALVTGLTLAGPVGFFVEFAAGFAAPLALVLMPGVKAMMVPLRWRPNPYAPRQAYVRCVSVVVVGLICVASMVAPMVQSIPAAAASMTFPWGGLLAALAGLVYFLALLTALALAYEQLAYE